MKTAKQLVYLTPLALLIAGCAVPVKPDTTIVDWEREGQLPVFSATGTGTERVYAQTVSYPMMNEPKILVTTYQQSTASDLAVGDAIRRRVEYDLSLAPSLQRVTILIQNGVVTLQGTVKSDMDARSIVDELRDVAGVTQVRNELEINPNWS